MESYAKKFNYLESLLRRISKQIKATSNKIGTSKKDLINNTSKLKKLLTFWQMLVPCRPIGL